MANMTFKRGDTITLTFEYKDDEDTVIDLTGSSARAQVRDSSDTLILSADTETGNLTILPTVGKVVVNYFPPETKLVAPGTYFSDLEMTYADGTVQSTETFTITILEDITKDAS